MGPESTSLNAVRAPNGPRAVRSRKDFSKETEAQGRLRGPKTEKRGQGAAQEPFHAPGDVPGPYGDPGI